MAKEVRIPIASLSTGALDYPLAQGWLIRTVESSGREAWEVDVVARTVFNLTQDLSYQLYVVAKDGQSYVGVAVLQNQLVRNGIEWRHRFLGNDTLGLGLKMPVA